MSRFLFNLSDGEARQEHVQALVAEWDTRIVSEGALEETFDPEAAKPTDNPFPEELKDETPVSDSPEAPAEEAAVEEETPMPVGRKCSVCGETGHNKRNCPTLAAEEATEAGVSESNGGKDATTEQTAE